MSQGNPYEPSRVPLPVPPSPPPDRRWRHWLVCFVAVTAMVVVEWQFHVRVPPRHSTEMPTGLEVLFLALRTVIVLSVVGYVLWHRRAQRRAERDGQEPPPSHP